MAEARDQRHRKSLLLRLLDTIGSVWFGISILVALLVYSSVGSAIPPLRQMRIFEMTEFEWFNWWPFVSLCGLLCIALTIVTIRRIPLTRINLGVWMIHSGVVLMTVSSAYYFLTKTEGDTPVIRRSIVASAPGAEPVTLMALPGSVSQVGEYLLQVIELQPDWPILTGEDAGKTAYAVRVQVQSPERSFIRQILAGYPQYTEDILPGQGRAITSTGERLVDANLTMGLEFAPQDIYFERESRALYVRGAGETEWSMRNLHGLPRYNDYVGSLSDVWLAPTEMLEPHPIAVRATPVADDALRDETVRVTGFLRYAFEQERWSGGGQAHYPAVDFSLLGEGANQPFTLAAFDPSRATTPGGEILFLWVDTESAFEALSQTSKPEITITVASTGLRIEADTSQSLQVSPALSFIDLESNGYAYRIRRFDNTPVGAFAAVDLRTPSGEFTRWLSNDGNFMDLPIGISDESAQLDLNESITVSFRPGRSAPPLAIVAGPDPGMTPRILLSPDGATVQVGTPRVGEPFAINERVSVVIDRFSAHARFSSKPTIVPRRQRDRDAGELFSMVRVEITEQGQTVSTWVPFNQYVFPSNQYAYQGRFRHTPVAVTLPSGRNVELLYSRVRRPLPAPVVLDDFLLTSHVGGFSGQTSSIRDWISQIRFQEAGGAWSEPLEVSTNQPAEFGGYWFFQQSWDPPQPRQGTSGMNFTGLGVGNRNGVYAMLAGSTLSVIGMLYAFYIKPVLKRRRVRSVLAALAQSKAEASKIAKESQPEFAEASA